MKRMRRRGLGLGLAVAAVCGLWLNGFWQTAPATPAKPSTPAPATGTGSGGFGDARTRADTPAAAPAHAPGSTPTANPSAKPSANVTALPQQRIPTLFHRSVAEPIRWQQQMRMTAIRQANAFALVELPHDVVRLLAELRLVEAQQLLEQLSEQGYSAADRLLYSMAVSHGWQQPCLPNTEALAAPIPILTLQAHDKQLREALTAAPPEIANLLVDTLPVFERQEVLAACAELTLDGGDALQRVFASAVAGDDEDRTFIQKHSQVLAEQLPPRPADSDGNPRPPYSRAEREKLAGHFARVWSGLAEDRITRVHQAALDAEPYPELYGRAGYALQFPFGKTGRLLDPARAADYLDKAAERGELLALQHRGMQLIAQPEVMEQGYLLGLFARHLNARGCYPDAYLTEWARSYRYVEAYAQAMSPVTLDVVLERAERYIAEYGPDAYRRLHCQ